MSTCNAYYFLTIIDDYSCVVWVYFLLEKIVKLVSISLISINLLKLNLERKLNEYKVIMGWNLIHGRERTL